MRSVRWIASALVLVVAGSVAGPAQAVSGPPSGKPVPGPIDDMDYSLTLERLSVNAPRPPRGATVTGPTRADIDGDGVDDIVIGSSVGVHVDYSRLTHTDLVRPRNRDLRFDSAISTGDFDGDGFDDLAVGSTADGSSWHGPIARNPQAGAVWTVPGGPDGLRIDRARHINQDTPGVPSVAAQEDLFGQGLATGDLNGDGRDDLAVYASNERDSGARFAGAVTVLYGGPDGITGSGAQQLTQAMAAVPGSARRENYFGWGLAIGNVTGDRYADLVVGAWGDADGRSQFIGTGKVYLFRGSAAGLSLTGVQQVTAPAVGTYGSHYVQYLGESLAIADLNGDGFGEVVAGAPLTQVGTALAGVIVVLRGTSSGLTLTGRQLISEASSGVPGDALWDDWFGSGLRLGDVTGDGRPDALIPLPGKSVRGHAGAGYLLLLPGTAGGLGTSGARVFAQPNDGMLCGPGADEGFGTVALLNLDGTGAVDALVATDLETTCGWDDGVVTVFGGGSGTLTGYGTVAAHTYNPSAPRITTYFGQLPT